MKARSFPASVVMSGRALEGVGCHFFPEKKPYLMLGERLKKLRASGHIDQRLLDWGTELADDRNWAAHPSGKEFDRQDAEDVFKFTHNICEYIFVLTHDFELFQRRRRERGRGKNL